MRVGQLRNGDIFCMPNQKEVFVTIGLVKTDYNRVEVMIITSESRKGQCCSLPMNEEIVPLQADFFLKDGKFIAEIL